MNSDNSVGFGGAMSFSNANKIWCIHDSTGRKIRICLKSEAEIVHIQMKLFRTKMDTVKLVFTLAEFQLLPFETLLDSAIYFHEMIYNGRRRVGVTHTDNDTNVFSLYKLDNDNDMWEHPAEIEITANELELFYSYIPEILKFASSQVFKSIVGTDSV